MQVVLNIPDEIPQEVINKLVQELEEQFLAEKAKILGLHSALIAGENSGVVENYSLANLLAELDSEELA